MSKRDEPLKLAQDWYDSGNENHDDFANMIKQVIALAEQPAQQEPLAWYRYETVYEYRNQLARCTKDCIGAFPVYTSPQRKPWVGLTDEQRGQIINANFATGLWSMAKDIEAKLKEKNS